MTFTLFNILFEQVEWTARKPSGNGYTVVCVKEHKMAAHQVAMFALDQEEEMVNKICILNLQFVSF